MQSETALDWCRQRYLVPGHPLTLTLPYAEPDRRDALLALNAVIVEIAGIPGQVSEPEVARRKLEWWRQALQQGEAHPAIQAWQASGAAESVPAEEFGDLIAAVAREIDPPRFEQVRELETHAREVAGPAALLEVRLLEAPGGAAGALAEMAGAMYRVRIVRDLVLDAGQDRWLVPLELQAEYQLTRQQVAAGEPELRLAALVRHMAADAMAAHDRAMRTLPPDAAWRHRHLVLRLHLDRTLGRALLRRPLRIRHERITTTGLPALFSLWRRARQLRR
ncbi:MAG: squalene/phytoene synthase family protein, partial [Wenzhouxiangellaceae bacterium]